MKPYLYPSVGATDNVTATHDDLRCGARRRHATAINKRRTHGVRRVEVDGGAVVALGVPVDGVVGVHEQLLPQL